jgi:hypothetical protein
MWASEFEEWRTMEGTEYDQNHYFVGHVTDALIRKVGKEMNK